MNILQILGGVLVISGAGQVIITQKPEGIITAVIGAFVYKTAESSSSL